MSGLSKNELIFDPAAAEETDSIKSFLSTATGLLTSTTIGPKEAIDINIAGFDAPIDVNFGPMEFILDGSPVTVLEDTVTPANNRPLPVKLTSVSGPINITAGDLNVQLTHTGATPDSTQIGDGTEIVNITPNNDMQVVDRANSGFSTAIKTITDTQSALVDSVLPERKYLEIQNEDNRALFIGPPGVTAANGFKIPKKSSWSGRVGPAIVINGIRSSGQSGDIRILQLA